MHVSCVLSIQIDIILIQCIKLGCNVDMGFFSDLVHVWVGINFVQGIRMGSHFISTCSHNFISTCTGSHNLLYVYRIR